LDLLLWQGANSLLNFPQWNSLMFGVTKRLKEFPNECQIGIQAFYGSNNTQQFHSFQRIRGRFQELLQWSHPFLSDYIEALTASDGQMIITQTVYQQMLKDKEPDLEQVAKVTMQLVLALSYLEDQGVVCGNLSMDQVYICEVKKVHQDSVLLANWGLFYITDGGKDVDFPIGDPRYLSPEAILGVHEKVGLCNQRDVWSLGVLLLDWVLKRSLDDQSIEEIFENLEELNRIPQDIGSPLLQDFISQCLIVDYVHRPKMASLINHPFLEATKIPKLWFKRPFYRLDKCRTIDDFRPTLVQTLELWKLLGNDLEKLTDTASKKQAIFTLPTVVTTTDDAQELVLNLQGRPPYCEKLKAIPINSVFERISDLKNDQNRLELIAGQYKDDWKVFLEWNAENLELIWQKYEKRPNQLNSVEKERDFQYQYLRLFTFTKLLQTYPHSLDEIRIQALQDIPPVYSIDFRTKEV
jgi:TBC domain-containing protein kinase-like protein